MSGIDIAALRRMVTGIEGNDPQGSFANGRGRETGSGKGSGFGRARSFTLGFAPADAAFPHGLAGDALHEIFAENPGAHMVATGFALAFAARATKPQRPIIWIEEESAAQEYGWLYPPGLHAFGIDPARLLIVRCPTAQDVLKAANDALEAGSGGKASHLVSGIVASITG